CGIFWASAERRSTSYERRSLPSSRERTADAPTRPSVASDPAWCTTTACPIWTRSSPGATAPSPNSAEHSGERTNMTITTALSICGIGIFVAYEVVLRRREVHTATWKGDRADRSSTRLIVAAYAAIVVINVILAGSTVGSI